MLTEPSDQALARGLRRLYQLLCEQVPSESWWPGESRFEIVVGAVLTQNTTWVNVQRALAALRQGDLLNPQSIVDMPRGDLENAIRPCGYYRTKAEYLRSIGHWFLERDAEACLLPCDRLRQELLALRGIGPETADDILLYVYHHPVFIYDAYARRLIAAAGLGDYAHYEAARRALDPAVNAAQFTVAELAQFHGLIVDSGKIARRYGGWEQAYSCLLDGTFGQ
ncbi:endonuclease III domain-containing protein [Trueperella sp. LYQ141]|uniref:endonuclease III domain-containing protein n=1 Tax=Trueperella sp. LYQ141 TaxID=3391058 RepID=UPI003983AEA0